MSKGALINAKKLLKELVKHAERDDCYNCNFLLKEIAANYMVDVEDLKKMVGEA